MSEHIVKSVAFEHLKLNLILNIPNPVSSSREVLNEKVEDSDDAQNPKLRYSGIGIGGEVNNFLRIPSKRNLTLYSLIPIRITNANDEFEQGETRDDYRLRYPLLKGRDIVGYAYYLKTLKNKNNGNTIFTETLYKDTNNPFKYSDADIRKYLTGDLETPVRYGTFPPGAGSGILPYIDPDDDTDIIEKVTLRLSISKNDINSVINFHQDEKYGLISEIGLFTGYDVVDSTTGYNEAKDVQLALINTFNTVDLRQLQSNKNLNIDIEMI